MSDRILRIKEVRAVTGLGRTSVYRLAQAGSFPQPIKLGERASGWRESEIQGWIIDRANAPRRGQK